VNRGKYLNETHSTSSSLSTLISSLSFYFVSWNLFEKPGRKTQVLYLDVPKLEWTSETYYKSGNFIFRLHLFHGSLIIKLQFGRSSS
jgi:hypothetical protein